MSHNGTYVNGERLRASRVLRAGDVITTGDTQLAFIAPAGGSISATLTAAHAAAAPEVTPAQRRVLVALCRPLSAHGAVASNREIADELVVALDTVKGTLSRLFEVFGIGGDVPQNQKRALLARRAVQAGIVGEDDSISSRSATACSRRGRTPTRVPRRPRPPGVGRHRDRVADRRQALLVHDDDVLRGVAGDEDPAARDGEARPGGAPRGSRTIPLVRGS